MNITSVHHNLPHVISKGVVKSMIGSLNATVIAYARMHLRYNAKPIEQDGIPTIDKANEELAALDEQIARDHITDSQGFNPQMSAGELVDRLMGIRNYFIQRLAQMKDAAHDTPLSIAETIKFQCDRTPDSNDALLAMLAEAVEMDVDMLKAAQVKMLEDDASDLRANAAKIADYLGQFHDEHSDFDDSTVETNFDKLPAHVQFKLVFAAVRAHNKATQRAMVSLLRGKLDAAGDIKMLKANVATLTNDLHDFSAAKRIELDAYVERGGSLPDLEDRTIVTSNVKKEALPATGEKALPKGGLPQSPMLPVGEADVSKMRRAPAPVAQ